MLLYNGIDGALNTVGKTGVLTPIDASRYRRLSFRAKRSVGTPDVIDRIGAFWFPNSNLNTSGFALWQARGILAGSQHANMMPQAAPAGRSTASISTSRCRAPESPGAASSAA
jgi:hypothetical protein